ncbi:hypothetical protein BGX30_001015 [Mortierella sp. GBA39]|nr:hypothetical protein BGX30_001015 [Mortierella sp. GBA39]
MALMGRDLAITTGNKKAATRFYYLFPSSPTSSIPTHTHTVTRNMEDDYLFAYRYSGEMQYGVRHRWQISLPILPGEPHLSPIFYLGRHLLRMEIRQTVFVDCEAIDFLIHLLRYDGAFTFDMELKVMSTGRITSFENHERTVLFSRTTTTHLVKDFMLCANDRSSQTVILEVTRLELNSTGLPEFAYGAQQFLWRAVSRFEELEYSGFDQSRRGLNLDVAFSRLKRLIYLTLDGNDMRGHGLKDAERMSWFDKT